MNFRSVLTCGIVCLIAVCIMHWGCSKTPTGNPPAATDSATVTISAIGTVTAGMPKTVSGAIVASQAPTMTYSIRTGAGALVTDSTVYASYQQVLVNDFNLENDAQLKINSTIQVCNGNYMLIVRAVSGTVSHTDTMPFTITGGISCGAATGVIINAIGSVSATVAKTISGTIVTSQVPTLTYSIKTALGSLVTDSTVYARYVSVSSKNFTLENDAQLQIMSTSQACNGNYQLIIRAVAGANTYTDTAQFTIIGGKVCTTSDFVAISIGAIGTVTAGVNTNVTGTVASNNPPTITYTILDSNGTAVAVSKVTTSATAVAGKDTVDLAADAHLKISATASACNGAYTLVITATAGTATTTKNAQFVITGATNCGSINPNLTTATDTLGSWQNIVYGQSLDADNMQVYKVSQVTAAVQPSIDVWFSNVATEADLFSPNAPDIDGMSWPPASWTTRNVTEFKKAAASTNFGAITSQGQIDALWGSGAGTSYIAIVAGDVIVIKTAQGNYRLLKIILAEAENVGRCAFQGKVQQ